MTEQRTRADVKEIKDTYEFLFNASHSLSKIKDAALGGRLFRATDDTAGVAGRSLAWKLFLVQAEPLQTPADVISVSPLEALRASRKEYARLLLEKMQAPDGSYEEGLTIPGTSTSPPRVEPSRQNLDKNNPLSLDDENPWTKWFESMDLRKTILQDVERTFPDIGYFRDTEVQTQLTNILFVHSIMHPDIGYRQGMHELLAPLYYAVDYDSIPEDNMEPNDAPVKEFCSRAWIAADAWALFVSVMGGIGRWYEWQETKTAVELTPLGSHVQVSSGEVKVKPYVAPIVEACNRVQSTYLKAVDPELWKSMQSAGIEPQIYGIRWLRLLFTREFNMNDAMIIWDGLFACDPAFDLAEWLCVVMLIRIRNKLIPSDYSEQLTYLLRYPSSPSSSSSSSNSSTIHHATLLLRQALTLQMSPSPSTGVSVIYENRNLLGIPTEVPEPPPPPPRRRPRPSDRGQSFSANIASRREQGSTSKSAHARQQSTPMGLPEMFARGLLERGESLGINKTVMNAVSELKRNLPDLATSLGRLPITPNTSYAAYPLIDERPPAERPPWESKGRFEVERELTQLRSLQKRLGDSVGWIVDTLLLDEEDKESEDHVKVIRERKREALECLSYVRDVLKGTVTEVEEERLVGEEELRKRKLKEQQGKEEESHQQLSPRLPQPIAYPARPQPISRPQDHFTSRQQASRSPPRPAVATPPISILRRAPQSHISSSSPTPNTNATPLAPWNHTRSDFGRRESTAILPRVPPPTSTALRPNDVPSAYTLPSTSLKETISDDRRKEVQQDPLGALP
ncbi:hypothetical protein AcW1_005375 [Taiwanofungus camphoratus]|nr:hypothetical protein AcW1_005375 [Antrodia cinnamomea]